MEESKVRKEIFETVEKERVVVQHYVHRIVTGEKKGCKALKQAGVTNISLDAEGKFWNVKASAVVDEKITGKAMAELITNIRGSFGHDNSQVAVYAFPVICFDLVVDPKAAFAWEKKEKENA